MDMTFRDDECPVPTDHVPANLAVIGHTVQDLIRHVSGKESYRLRRKAGAWDDGSLAKFFVT